MQIPFIMTMGISLAENICFGIKRFVQSVFYFVTNKVYSPEKLLRTVLSLYARFLYGAIT
jgi:hypothetical protein